MHSILGGIPWDMLVFTLPGVLLGGYTGAKLGHYLERNAFKKLKTDDTLSGKSKILQSVCTSPLRIIFASIAFLNAVLMFFV